MAATYQCLQIATTATAVTYVYCAFTLMLILEREYLIRIPQEACELYRINSIC